MNRRCLILLALLLAPPAFADDGVVFRCTDANGKVTVQDGPCPSGSAQIIQRRGAAATSTVSTALGSEGPAPAPGILDSSLLPTLQAGVPSPEDDAGILDSNVVRERARAAAEDAPPKPPLPEIHSCVGNEGSHYLHEYGPAPPRCAPLAITGLGGSFAPGNAASCEVVRDSCTALPEDQRCRAWQQRFRDARGRERFSSPENQAAASADRERLQAVLGASDCAVPD